MFSHSAATGPQTTSLAAFDEKSSNNRAGAPMGALTHWRAPRPIGKHFWAEQDAASDSPTLGRAVNIKAYDGDMRTRAAPTATALATILDSLTSHEALILGVMRDGIERADLTTVGKERPGALTRTRANFVFRDGPTWALLDVDAKEMPAAVLARVEAMGGLVAAILSIWPEMASAAHVIRPSSSAGVHLAGQEPAKAGSLHVYVLVERGTDIPAMVEILHRRAMVAGFGWAKVAKGGAIRPCSIIDASVGKPERISFEGAPLCGPGVLREVPATIAHDGPPIAAPTDDVPAYAATWAVERAKVEDEASATRGAAIERKAQDITAKTGKPLDEARKVAVAAYGGGVLDDDWPILTPQGKRRLGDLLDARYAGYFADPVEPNRHERSKARIRYHANGLPSHIVSFAHGQPTEYKFARDPLMQPAPPAEPESWVPTGITLDVEPGFYAHLCKTARRIAPLPGKEAEALYLVPSPAIADAVHEATGCEVIVLDSSLESNGILELEQRAIVAMVTPGRDSMTVRAVAETADSFCGNVWVCEASSPYDDAGNVLKLIRAAKVWHNDPAPWLWMGSDPEAEARRVAALDDQEAQAKAGAELIRETIADVVEHEVRTAAGRKAAKRILFDNQKPHEVELEALTDVERQDAQRERARAIRAAKREAAEALGLDALPPTRRRRNGAMTDDDMARRVAITGAQGIGKTAALVGREGQPGAIHTAKGLSTLLAFPTTAKASEAFEDYIANAPAGGDCPPAVLLRGRGAPAPDGNGTMCEIPEAAAAVQKAGGSAAKALCATCPFATTCRYQAQFAAIEVAAKSDKGVAVFGSHGHLASPIKGLDQADIVCIDESPLGTLTEKAELSAEAFAKELALPARLGRWPVRVDDEPLFDDPDEEKAHRLRTLYASDFAPVAAAIREGLPAGRVLAVLRERGITADALKRAKKVAEKFIEASLDETRLAPMPGETAEVARKRTAELAGKVQGQPAAVLWRLACGALADELEARPDQAEAMSIWHDAHKDEIHAVAFKSLRYSDAAVILTDGTANMDLAKPALGKLRNVEIKVARRLDVTQVVGASFSETSLVGNVSAKDAQTAENSRRDIVTSVERIVGKEGDPKRVLVVGQRKVINKLRPQLKAMGVHIATFGALRGLNTFKDCTAIVVIGRLMPTPGDIENAARPWLARQNRAVIRAADGPLTGPEVEHVAKNGETRKIATPRHPDELVEAVRSQTCEAELLQAIDRLRPIFCDGLKRVYALGHHITVQPDRFVEWSEWREGGTVWERMAESGLIPDTPGAAYRLFPQIVGSRDTAERHYRARPDIGSLLPQTPIVDSIGLCGIKPSRVRWKAAPIPGTRQRESFGWVFAHDAAAAHAIVERLAGPLASFDLVEQPQPASATQPTAVVPPHIIAAIHRPAEIAVPAFPLPAFLVSRHAGALMAGAFWGK